MRRVVTPVPTPGAGDAAILSAVGGSLSVGRYQPLERHVLVAGGGLQQHGPAPRDPVTELDECRPEPAVRAGTRQQLGVAGECSRSQLPFKVLKRS
jgi:hypothetical protein